MDKITTYKTILELIIKFEKDEENFRKQRFTMLSFFFGISLIIIVVYAVCKWSSGVAITKPLVGVSLSSIFSYLLRSYEEDYLSQQRAHLIDLIHKTFGPEDKQSHVFGDEPVDFDAIKEIIHNALKSKL